MLDYGDKPLLIDEGEAISFIWNSLKEKIDENDTFSQYILTGSVTDATVDTSFAGQKKERYTGTGRIIRKLMMTMFFFESAENNGKVSLEGLRKGSTLQQDHPRLYLLCLQGRMAASDWD